MNYSETVEYMFRQLPMYQRIGKAAYKADLKTSIQLLDYLDNPEQKFKSIHIAGTNGKGSVSHIIASVLQTSGLKTGLYTSPHLKDFRERIRIDGKLIDKNYVVDFINKNKAASEKLELSFFEMTVGMAFQYFLENEIDIAVVETGMGGRLDSTNLINPELSIITNIGLDHTQFLGDTIEKIAVEKAGIIKNNIPVIIGETQEQIKNVFIEKAKLENSQIFFADQNFKAEQVGNKNIYYNIFNIKKNGNPFLEKIKLPLTGDYQSKNLITSLQSLDTLKEKFEITNEHISEGIFKTIENTGLMGRWQILKQNPLTICDTGHNFDGIKYVVEQIGKYNFDKLHFVLGMLNDKEIDNILKILPPKATYYFCKANIPRGLDAGTLKEKANCFGLNGETFKSVNDAFQTALKSANNSDMIFVGGSTFIVAEVV
ncbi:MAG: bifunctional folylpolyglutamate synthase/dihydrofolate synthase [Bacteroidales bacterium]|nr:bifunctional folylpolyglutamate synthase/dihydrofolate synthase [Bacteroidales bacterium]